MSGLYSVDMDPATARQANQYLGTVLILDVPSGVHFGMDHQVFAVGTKFCGIKMIPPGWHFISVNAVRPDTASAPVSFFHEFGQSEILIRQWDPSTEQLQMVSDTDQEERFRLGVQNLDFDDGLAPYDISQWKQWKKLSGWIDRSTVERLMDGADVLSIAEEARGIEGLSPNIPSEAALIAQLQRSADAASHPQRLKWTPFPVLIKRPGCSPAELSAMNLDKSEELDRILANSYATTWTSILAELQFSFVVFLLGQSLQGLEQWKKILHLLLGCFDGVLSHKELFRELLRVLRHQLELLLRTQYDSPISAEMAELLSESFLKTDIMEFLKSGISEEGDIEPPLYQEGQKLAALLREKLHWDVYEDNDDEYAPVIVT